MKSEKTETKTEKEEALDIFYSRLPRQNVLLVYFQAKGYNGYIGRKAEFYEVADRLEKYGAQRPENARPLDGKIFVKGQDEHGADFWVSAEHPNAKIPYAWPYEPE